MKKYLLPITIALSALSVSGSAAFYSVFGLLLIGFGLSVLGEAIIKKYENHPDWFYWGTVALVIFNSGICIVIKASSIKS